MMKVSVTVNTTNLSERDLRQMSQLGVDCVDFGSGSSFPGVQEQGYPDLDELLRLKRKVRSWGMDINRVTLPDITQYMEGTPGSEQEIENAKNALTTFAEAGLKLVRQRFAGDVFPDLAVSYKAEQRGGAVSRGESLGFAKGAHETPTLEEHNHWWARFREVYNVLVPLADEHDVKLAVHPSDTPHHDTPFGGLGLHRIIDDFPSKNVGFVYCIGTRAEAGGTPLVLDEINHFGRKEKLFLVHFRNVRGSLATAGAFEEALLDDGDMNMFKFILELRKVGFDGCLNPDHVPIMDSDNPDTNADWVNTNIGWTHSSNGFSYSIGYIKALLAALVEFEGAGRR